LDVEALDLGLDVKAISMEILETESREPVRENSHGFLGGGFFPAAHGQRTLRR